MPVPHRDLGPLLGKHGFGEVKKIGEGSFGKALLVQAEDGAKLVCKAVDVSAASSKETQDAIKESRLLAALKHPYIVRYRHSFHEQGWLCIFMDYCEGGDLSKIIESAKRRSQRLPEEQVLRWITQALLALKYIHEKHVLHRDLKSGNFFISSSGNLKMGDFGIAKVLSSTLACARTQIGTPYYLSPEVCQEKPYAWPSDIWAMGCILYELCALKVPFDAPNISTLVQRICRGPTPALPSSYSDFLRQLNTEMLSRNPAHRPSAETILQRPPMQAMVKHMLEEAQAAQEGRDRMSSGHKTHDTPLPPPPPPAPAPGVSGPYADFAGTYRKGDFIEYHSSTHKEWLPAQIIDADQEGRIVIDLKPGTWIARAAQAMQVRPRRTSPPVPAPAVAPMRQRSPRRQRSPSVGRPAREFAILREPSPWHRPGGSREPSPRRHREPSPLAGGSPHPEPSAPFGRPSRSVNAAGAVIAGL
ncbi:unnamed protein product [Effrenium voratum]|uniref:non-specific serine/threonine protein kinase n=1 Tax=Effrenium voratum TaxID=2562239 RepID=A0AA36J1E8_9DINO|nr:unnamed protein product [Effrenium voratum]CAJ1443562.1 unnamed protein product [Effrenium voratum]